MSDDVRVTTTSGLSVERLLRLLDTGEMMGEFGSWEWFPEVDELYCSENMLRLLGLPAGETTAGWKLALEHTHPEDRLRVTRFVDRCRQTGRSLPIEFRLPQSGRSARRLRATVTTTASDERGPTRTSGVVQDVTEARLAGREIAMHLAVSDALEAWDDFDDGGTRVLRAIAEAMEFDCGALWVIEDDFLTARLVWSAPSLEHGTEFETVTMAHRVSRSMDAAGLAWQRKKPVIIGDVAVDSGNRRRAIAARVGLHGAVAFPALHANEVLAVLEFHLRDMAPPAARLTQTLLAVGQQMGQFLATRSGQMYPSPLTARELQVLQLVADGQSGPRIAELLVVSATTVRTHMKHIFEALGVDDRAAAVAAGIRRGLIT